MEKVYWFRIVVTLIILTFLGCGFNKNDLTGVEEVSSLTKSEYDSLRHEILFNKRPDNAFKVLLKLEREVALTKDPHMKARRYRLMIWYYIKSSNFKKGDSILDKVIKYYKDYNKWSDYVSFSKIAAIFYRKKKKYKEMESLLKEAIEVAEEKNVYLYDLLPVHELSIFYSYDMKNYSKAIKYGEIFFDKIKKYDTVIEERKLLDSIKRFNVDVLNLELAKSYINTNNLVEGFKYLQKAESEFRKHDDVDKLTRVYRYYVDYYLKKNDLVSVKHYREKYLNYNERKNDTLVFNLNEIMQSNIHLSEKEKDLALLEEGNKRKVLVIGGLGALLLILIVFQRYFLRLKYEKEKIYLDLEKEQEFKKFRASLFINIAHEIRTPLALIMGYVDLLEEQSMNEMKFKKYLVEIKKKSNKIIKNITDIISLLKEDKKEEKLKLENVVIEPFLQQLFFSFESVAKIKNIELNYNARIPSYYKLQTDLNKLESLISNLVSNAIKFSPKNTEVSFNTYMENDFFHIHVKDEGSGISREHQKNIFNKFYQEDKRGKSEGFGIGLAIVKDITDKLNGTVIVESELNEGATFKVKFPIINNKELYEDIEVVSKRLKSKSDINYTYTDNPENKQSKVLIVEDNPYMIDYYKKILSTQYNLEFAFNGEEGLEKLKENQFDLVVSDVMMPKMDGIEFRKEMKNFVGGKDIPFILVTALGYEENKIEAFNIGVDDYIVKPFSKNELIARISCLLENKEKRESWMKHMPEEENKTETFEEKNLKRLKDIVLDNIDKENFPVSLMAKEVNLSQRQLERITKKLTGLTPVKFVLEIRLQEAYKKIKNKEEVDINNVRYSIGMKSASYFSVKFKERFGISPSELLKES
ncbi:hybrid sensor histidine kinase/response regulator transcription factor [Tenacibaculum xiamenense]|uniref:hybrid sensor histidine kinase/response regulator transcription factor n=1 Tax=Tenacibaculum xiamenense TaxID=1261553 RepID=UPI0038959D1A